MSGPNLPDPFGVRAHLLDCVQSNLAVLADHFHGAGTHLNLGSKLSSRFYPDADGLPTVDPPLAEELSEAERTLHLAVGDEVHTTGAALSARVARGELRYAVADAYEMSWLPYFGRQHMEHSFLLMRTDGADGARRAWTVVDAYDNDTQWGSAKPGTWTLTEEELTGLSRVRLFEIAPKPGPAVRPRPRVEHVPVDDYLAAFDQGPDRERVLARLTGDTWLLARSRRLHALFMGAGDVDEETARHLESWDGLVTQTYLTHRRVARGRPEPPGTVQQLAALLDEDRRIFEPANEPQTTDEPHAADGAPSADPGLRHTIATVVGSVLDADPAVLLAGDGDLSAVEGFTSFRMVDIIDRLEARLDIEFDSDDLVPENLRSMDGLCRIVRGAPGSR